MPADGATKLAIFVVNGFGFGEQLFVNLARWLRRTEFRRTTTHPVERPEQVHCRRPAAGEVFDGLGEVCIEGGLTSAARCLQTNDDAIRGRNADGGSAPDA